MVLLFKLNEDHYTIHQPTEYSHTDRVMNRRIDQQLDRDRGITKF